MSRLNTSFKPLATALLLAFGALSAAHAATITITSRDAAGVGFNDTTPVAPVGGNPGTTLGQQRLNVYRYVANIWEAALQSTVPITVSAAWEPLTCTATSAVLGSASAWNIWHDFAGSKPGTWTHQALANKLAGVNLSAGIPDDGTGYGNVDIKTQFNINLGNTGCLDGSGFYLGLDGNAGTKINFATTLLHELGHGLGFSVLTSNASGFRINAEGTALVEFGGLPAVWEEFMYDNTTGKTWLNMTSLERKASAINPLQLAWIGSNGVTAAAQTLLATPQLRTSSSAPGSVALYDIGRAAAIGPVVGAGPTAFSSLVTVPTPATGAGCTASGGVPATVAGKVALIDRGSCSFAEKAKNAQNAGAVGVVIANNAAGPAPALGGADPTVTIPVVSVSQADGVTLKAAVLAAVKYGSRTKPGALSLTLTSDPARRAGADALGRPLLYTPATLAGGSSVSHWDVSAFPNLLMEPAINGDLTTLLVPPKDLTVPLFKDIGWTTPTPAN
jgi:PA domain